MLHPKQAWAALLLLIGMLWLSSCSQKYEVKREAIIKAPVESVFAQVKTFNNFLKWSPWQELDPNQKVTFSGTDGTVGAKYSWSGNDKVGTGSMTITAIDEGKRIDHDLAFEKPFESNSKVYMTTEAVEGGTKVVWGMTGENNAIASLFMAFSGGMDGMVGKDYEKGLAKLKELCEATPAYQVKEVNWAAKTCLSVRENVKFADMPAFFMKHFPAMAMQIGKNGATPGIPLGIYYNYDEAKGEANLAAAIPYEGKPVSSKEYKTLEIPAAKAYQIDYYGAYENMKPAYDEMNRFLHTKFNLTNPDMVIEEYVGDPETEKDPAKLYTRIYFFVNASQAAK